MSQIDQVDVESLPGILALDVITIPVQAQALLHLPPGWIPSLMSQRKPWGF